MLMVSNNYFNSAETNQLLYDPQ